MLEFIKKIIAKLKQSAKTPFFWTRMVMCCLFGVAAWGYLYEAPYRTPAPTTVSKAKSPAKAASSTEQTQAALKELKEFKALNKTDVKAVEVYSYNHSKNVVVLFNDGTKGVYKSIDNNTYSAVANTLLVPMNVPMTFKDGTEYVLTYESPEAAGPEPWYTPVVSGVLIVGKFLLNNFFMILILLLTVYLIRATTSLQKNTFNILHPDDIKGSMDDLVGMADIKKEVRSLMTVFHNKDAYKKYGVDRPFNIMFTGPAGVGKTKIAGYFAKELGLPILTAEGSSLETGFVGGGSKTLQKIHQEAVKLKKCVVFLDEAQSLFVKRGTTSLPGSGSKYVDDTANTFLSLLDGIKSHKDAEIIWIVASNFDDNSMEMDEAMLRRFQLKVNFRLPNRDERLKIVKNLLTNKDSGTYLDLVDPNVDLSEIAEITSDLSPALLETVVAQAKIEAVEAGKLIDAQILFKSYERTVIGLTDRETTSALQKTREIVASHELGHFMVQFENAMKASNQDFDQAASMINTLKISTESVSKMNALGYVLSKKDETKLQTRTELEAEIVKLYGGVAAEEVIYGEANISMGSHNDIQKATELLSVMVNQLSMYKRSKLNYTQLNKDIVNKDQVLAELEALSASLYQQAIDIIHKHRAAIDYLHPILLDKYVLSKEEVFDHLRVFYGLSATFVSIEDTSA